MTEDRKRWHDAAQRPASLSDPDAPDLTELLAAGKARLVGRPKQSIVMQGIYVRLKPQTVNKLRSSGRGWQVRLREKVDEWVRLGML